VKMQQKLVGGEGGESWEWAYVLYLRYSYRMGWYYTHHSLPLPAMVA